MPQTRENSLPHFGKIKCLFGGADEILDQMRSLTGGGHAHVFLRRTIEGRSALHPV